MGIVLQNPANQFISQRVLDEVLFSLKVWNKNQTEKWYTAKAMEMLEAFQLGKYHRYSPYMLSQGQQRRLAVLSMIVGGQEILLLDEPTYGQDYRSTMAIMELLTQRVEEDGLTVIFSTHDTGLAQNWADAIFIMEDGKLKHRSLNRCKISERVI
ncbi:MAG: ABC transporter ATP-binding protein [Clostridia bacterium]|nr:ABC transporter ATP-binding protein [Clostridia bacterium]